MKKLGLLLALVLPLGAVAQKPGIPKAEQALNAGDIATAKDQIDLTLADEKFMVDKKGGPSKNAARAWYVKAVVYAAIDTSSNAQIHNSAPNAYEQAKEAFAKAADMDPDGKDQYIANAQGLPVLFNQMGPQFAVKYFDDAIIAFDQNQEYKKAFDLVEKVIYYLPGDTSVLFNAGTVFAVAAEEYDRSIELIREYIAAGGPSPEVYETLYAIYRDRLKDNQAALDVAREAMAKYPNNMDYPKFEFDILVQMEKFEEARTSLEKQVVNDPTDAQGHYFLGILNEQLEDPAAAKKEYEEALKIDPGYFDAQINVAEMVYRDARVVKNQMSQLGITAADRQKRLELDKQLVAKLQAALPYYETAEKLNPDDERVLDGLYNIYTDLGMDAKLNPLKTKMRRLGLID